MNSRRSFFRTVAAAVAGFTILPSATTYSRIWKAQRQIINPDWVDAPYEIVFDPRALYGSWRFEGYTILPRPRMFIFDPPSEKPPLPPA